MPEFYEALFGGGGGRPEAEGASEGGVGDCAPGAGGEVGAGGVVGEGESGVGVGVEVVEEIGEAPIDASFGHGLDDDAAAAQLQQQQHVEHHQHVQHQQEHQVQHQQQPPEHLQHGHLHQLDDHQQQQQVQVQGQKLDQQLNQQTTGAVGPGGIGNDLAAVRSDFGRAEEFCGVALQERLVRLREMFSREECGKLLNRAVGF